MALSKEGYVQYKYTGYVPLAHVEAGRECWCRLPGPPSRDPILRGPPLDPRGGEKRSGADIWRQLEMFQLFLVSCKLLRT